MSYAPRPLLMLKFSKTFRFIASKPVTWMVVAVIVLGAVAFAAAHAQVQFWAMDDAAISYAYARAMAHGTLATFPEGPVVEGYSNPLLCFAVAGLYRLGLFDPITTHIKLEALLFGWTLACLFLVLRRRSSSLAATVGVLLFAACELMTKATYIWYGSGLENMLLTACLATLVWRADRALDAGPRPWLDALLLVSTALVRPEAAAYSAAIAGGLGAVFLLSGRRDRLRSWGLMVLYATVLFAAFLAWRWVNYRSLLPNTFFAKADHSGFMLHWRDYVVAVILPYCFVRWFALSAVVLLVPARWRDLGLVILLLLVSTTLMPAFKGADWMGDHRFATPLIAVSHLGFALTAAALLSVGTRWWSRWLPLRLAAVVGTALLLWGLYTGDNPLRKPVALNGVNIGHVAYIQAVQRIEHQRRAGLVNPTVVMPDAGATSLIGGLRLIDSGYLTDFQMARIRDQMQLVDQYQHAEQQSEMAGLNRNPLYNFNWALLGQSFVQHPDQNMLVRRDLVELPSPPPGGVPVVEAPGVRVYQSPRNVFVAGPDGLVRAEIIVERESTEAASALVAQAALSGFASDEIRLVPYGPLPSRGTERRAFLLSAPHAEGRYDIQLTLRGQKSFHGPVTLGQLEVTRDPQRAQAVAAEIVSSTADARERAWLLAHLREQLPSRMSTTEWKAKRDALALAKNGNEKAQSDLIDRFTWDVRLGADDPIAAGLAPAVTEAGVSVIEKRRCEQYERASDRLLCLGRQVQWLRSLGIFDMLRDDRVRQRVASAEALSRDVNRHERYRTLVGLALLHPGSAALQAQLVTARASLPSLPRLLAQ